MTTDLLGETGLDTPNEIVFSGDSGMSESPLLKDEIVDGGAATVLFGGIRIWDLAEIVFSGDALLVCFAFLLRYLGRTCSSQYKCHCFAV